MASHCQRGPVLNTPSTYEASYTQNLPTKGLSMEGLPLIMIAGLTIPVLALYINAPSITGNRFIYHLRHFHRS